MRAGVVIFPRGDIAVQKGEDGVEEGDAVICVTGVWV